MNSQRLKKVMHTAFGIYGMVFINLKGGKTINNY